MAELKLTTLQNGQILVEMEGTEVEISQMLCRAMVGNIEIASIVCGAIPTFLDLKKLSREGYCKTVIDAQGAKT